MEVSRRISHTFCMALQLGKEVENKSNPHGEARATGPMAWKKPNEGLSRTAKGKKEGSGGKMTHFHIGIAYDKDVVLCKQNHKTLTGKRFNKFVLQYFPLLDISLCSIWWRRTRQNVFFRTVTLNRIQESLKMHGGSGLYHVSDACKVARSQPD